MTTSGVYGFNPGLGEIVLDAFDACEVRSTALTQEHMRSARIAANMVLLDFANRGVNLWKVALFSTSLVQGTSSYSVDPSIVLILDAYIETTSSGSPIDRLILPVSRSEYSSYPNKTQQGIVTTYWHDRLITPTVSLYYTPDGTQPTLKYYAMQQVQDANYTSGQTVDVPAVWLPAFTDALAARLSIRWKPEKFQLLNAVAKDTWTAAAGTNTETANLYVSPQLGGYFSP